MGHYQIGPRIGAGGMAEVYLGTHEAIGGFRKLVVMKRLLGWQSGEDDAVESLLDEARIAGTINHPNVVTTLDIGLDGGSPYIVLEYLSGEDLLYVLHELHKRKASIPLGIACRIGASIAAALAQAHDVTLPDGTRRCIVHRDVTPSNIIVCYGGVTKLVDFGVARVVDDVPKTKAGTVKGKFSYLAPEQLTGAPLDGRTDVFQLGIVLWEMVTMKRLFEGKSDHERVNAVLNREIKPPSERNPALPTCLDRTIMRALERDPDKRHQTAHELESELLEALNALGSSGGDHSVGKWMQAAFPERYRWRLDLEHRTVTAAEIESSKDDLEVPLDGEAPDSAWSRRRLTTGPSRGTHGSMPSGSSLRGVAIHSPAPRPSRSVARYMIPALVVVAVAVWWLRREGFVLEDREPETANAVNPALSQAVDYEVDITVVPAQASIAIDGVVVGTGRYRANFADDGIVHSVTFTAPDHTTVQRRFRGTTTLEVNLDSLAPAVAAPAVPATLDATATVKPEPARTTHDARQRRRDRAPTSAITSNTASPAAAASTEAAGSGSAAPPARPKPADDFAPSSDNLDPFK